jgi:hypothetical protein
MMGSFYLDVEAPWADILFKKQLEDFREEV